MTAATGAKNGVSWPQHPLAAAHASATAIAGLHHRPPPGPHALPARAHGHARPLRGVLEQALRDHSSRRYSTRSRPSSGSGNAGDASVPALALVERPRPGRAVRRVEPDRGVALARRLLEREPVQARREAAAPPRRAHEQHPQVRAPGDSHVRALALGGVGHADVPGRLAVRVERHRAPGRRSPQPLADRADLEAVRRRAPALGRPGAVGLEAEPGRARQCRRVIRHRDPDVQRRGVHRAAG